MRGLWKPLGVSLLLALLVTVWSGALFDAQGLGTFVGVGAFTVLFTFVLVVYAVHPAARYLRGMRDVAPHLQVTRDATNWWGERHVVVRSPQGTWELHTELTRAGRRLLVRSPLDLLEHEIHFDAREAGRAGCLAVAQGRRPPTSSSEGRVGARAVPGGRATVLAGFAGALVLGAVVLAWFTSTSGTPFAVALARSLAWAVAGGGWFVMTVLGASAAWELWAPRHEALGRPGAGACMLVGVGLGASTVALVEMAYRSYAGQAWLAMLAPATLGLLAALAARSSLAESSPPVRVLNTAGAVVVVAAAVLLPVGFALLTVTLALYVLFQTWTSAAPTVVPEPA